jgi:two-component system heavy metal sensor histidine kinase CusS
MLNLRSIRVRLSIGYIVFTMSWMIFIGLFSWLYLRSALATSRQQTMERREQRLLRYMAAEWKYHSDLNLQQGLSHYLEAGVESDVVQLFELDGRRMYPVSGAAEIAWPDDNCKEPCFGQVVLGGHTMRTLKHTVTLDGRSVQLCMAGIVDEHYDILHNVLNSYLIAFPMMLIASISVGYLLSRRALEPVDRITSDARTIGILELGRRLPVSNSGDELQRLTETWNELLARLEGAVNRLTQFTSDISHDLRTSTSVMLTTAEVALRRERTGAEYRKALGTIAYECEATSDLLNDLLTIARTEAAQPVIEKHPVNLAELLEEICQQTHAQAMEKMQNFRYNADEEAWVLGNLSMLRRLITILIDNAINYTPQGGEVVTNVEVTGDRVRVRVTDTGIGIAADDTRRVFERFYRADPARNRDNGGSGLGLSIATWIADNHQATIHVTSKQGEASVFTVEMPRLNAVQLLAPQAISV